MKVEDLLIYTDGGSRGNPGLAACSFVAIYNGKILIKKSKFLNTATNNIAEYNAVILALEWILENRNIFQNKRVLFNLDSELVVRQLNGVYKIKNEELITLSLQIRKLLKEIGREIFFRHIPREENKIADALVNEELDKHF